jgi:hypothetical protein
MRSGPNWWPDWIWRAQCSDHRKRMDLRERRRAGTGAGDQGRDGERGSQPGHAVRGLPLLSGSPHRPCRFLFPPHRLVRIPQNTSASLDSFLFFSFSSTLDPFGSSLLFPILVSHSPTPGSTQVRSVNQEYYMHVPSLSHSCSVAHIFFRLYLTIHRRRSVSSYLSNPATAQSFDHLTILTLPSLHLLRSRHDGPSHKFPIPAAR